MRTRSIGLAFVIWMIALVSVGTISVHAAGPEYMNFWTEPFAEVDETCTGELVEITGTIRHHVVFVNDGAGGFHGNGIFVMSASGVSEGGTSYVASFTDQLSQYFAPGDAGSVGTAPFSFRLISNDGSPNLYVTGTFHITVNANGEVVTSWSDLTIVCR